MVGSLIRNWWAVATVGVVAILFGITAFMMPGATLASLVILFGAYALVSGIFEVAAGATGESMAVGSSRAWMITTGVLSIAAGLVTFFWPGVTAIALYTLIGVWAILAGVSQAIAAVARRHELQHTWLVAAGGAAMAIFGIYMFASRGGPLALAFALGTFAIVYGVLMLAASFQLKRVSDRVEVTVTRAGQRAGVTEDQITRR